MNEMTLMDWFTNVILPVLTLVLGGGLGWLFHIKAERKKAEGEASQTNADAAKSWQDVYQQTVDDLQKYIKELRADRDHLREDRNEIRKENDEQRKKWKEMEDEISELRRQVARNLRIVESMRPFLCGKVGCLERMTIELNQKEVKDEQ